MNPVLKEEGHYKKNNKSISVLNNKKRRGFFNLLNIM